MWLSRLCLLSHDLHTSSLASQHPVACRSTLNAIAAVFAEGSHVKEVVSLTGDCVYSVLKMCIGILVQKKTSGRSRGNNTNMNTSNEEEEQGREAERTCCHHILVQ